jgi:hypothetical protein
MSWAPSSLTAGEAGDSMSLTGSTSSPVHRPGLFFTLARNGSPISGFGSQFWILEIALYREDREDSGVDTPRSRQG